MDEDELQRLFEASWPDGRKDGYRSVLEQSFTWVTAHAPAALVGFVNVAWDGGIHFFLLDTTVHPEWRHRGIGWRLVREPAADCRGYLHVDADEVLMTSFYSPCGFKPTPAGVLDTRAARSE
ncbi:GNAT family N-acetyltransferase [Tenggerimyces flavus]|uniref:GNAT family N-acetyltransferase n=1 Tax=Tenggerimyces flavus TaxID=1708749 RepID=A0ABV7YKG7_9ACTN|nr:GNAT family N-acetyltransferase [Tenggerimyces flavus]